LLNNFFLLKEISKFLNKEISGFSVEEIFTQEKDKLVIKLTEKETSINKFIEFSCEDKNPYLLLRDNYKKAKKNVMNLLESIYGCEISGVDIFNNDRIVKLDLSNNISAYFLFIKSKNNFLFVTDGVISDSFKGKKELAGKRIEDVTAKKDDIPKKETETKKSYYRSKYRHYGDLIFKEIIYVTGKSGNEGIDNETGKVLDEKIKDIDVMLENPEYLLYNISGDFNSSLIRLSHLNDCEVIKYHSVNELVQGYLKIYYNKSVDVDLRKNVLVKKENQRRSSEKKMNSLNQQMEFTKNSGQFKAYGDLILSNIHLIKKGDEELELDGEGFTEKTKITLKRNLSPSENASLYYEKYKKQKNSVDLLNEKIIKLQKEIDLQKKEIEELKNSENIKLLKMTEKEFNREDETSRFRKFRLDEKFEVWVGKDSASNDLLTTRYSTQNDLWFHVRGASGSHTVLKISDKKNPPDKKIISQAASIAAYYSKARNASNVPVAYCEKKYVKKKKGFKEGSVVMEREKVIFVKPGLPENLT
jgi:predicted ribosome quality control (RQC) complex YloA/Tae2 family protein